MMEISMMITRRAARGPCGAMKKNTLAETRRNLGWPRTPCAAAPRTEAIPAATQGEALSPQQEPMDRRADEAEYHRVPGRAVGEGRA
jgi:hypothetical protein